MAKKVNGVVHNMYNNATDSGGYAIPPLATNLALGQLVVNTSESDPCVLFKTSAGKIVKIVSEEVITKALTDILGNSAADLDTLRELIAQFEGSANDILPMLVALTDRVTAAETALGNKANSSTVNAHINNRENPHGVTKAQVGLSNLRNVEQLGITETAADSSRLGGVSKDNFIFGDEAGGSVNADNFNFDNPVKSGFFKVSSTDNNSAGLPNNGAGWGLHINWSLSNKAGTTLFSSNAIDAPLLIRTRTSAGGGVWRTIYDSGNCNKPDIDWQAKTLIGGHGLDRGLRIGVKDDYFTISKADTLTRFTHKENESDAVNGHGYFDFFVDSVRSSDKLRFLLRDRNSNELIKVLANGNMGIGAPNPDTKLHLYQESGSLAMKVANGVGRLLVSVDNVGVGALWMQTNNSLKFGTNNAEIARFTTTGYFGVGTNNPTDRIHAVGNVRATEKVIAGGNVESNGSGIFAGDILAKKSGAVVFAANDQSGRSATRLNDLQDVKLPANLTAKMIMAYDPAQINADGTTGGYTFMPAVGVGTGKVVADDIESLPDITLEGSPYVAVSDKRLKENIRPLTGATNILLNFAAKEYEWSEEGKKLGLTDPRAYGLIAQEAAELKDIVDIVRPLGISDYLGVDYIKIVPILIAGFQEQNKEIGTVNRKIEAIRLRANKAYGLEDANAKKIETLESEVRELKRLMSN